MFLQTAALKCILNVGFPLVSIKLMLWKQNSPQSFVWCMKTATIPFWLVPSWPPSPVLASTRLHPDAAEESGDTRGQPTLVDKLCSLGLWLLTRLSAACSSSFKLNYTVKWDYVSSNAMIEHNCWSLAGKRSKKENTQTRIPICHADVSRLWNNIKISRSGVSNDGYLSIHRAGVFYFLFFSSE